MTLILSQLESNPDWQPEFVDDPFEFAPGYEPWFDYDEDEGIRPQGTCSFCDNTAVRDEPFAGKRCCNQCFNLLIGGDADDEPWRCGNATTTPTEQDAP